MAEWPYSTAQWKRLRLVKLSASPLCEACSMRGVMRAARAVDHVTAVKAGGDPFPPLSGLMALCIPCHNEKTRNVDQRTGKGVRFKGAGLDGSPIDPAHPWFTAGDTPSKDEELRRRGPLVDLQKHLVG